MATATNQSNDFVILGPTLAPGNKVFEAIHALYFLPENYKLVFTGTTPSDNVFYSEVIKLVERDGLADRVSFLSDADNSDAVIGTSNAENTVMGDSPEALASAILDIARAVA
jgi:hypothetical protein